MFSSDTTQVADGGYQISRSLRFNSADSAYLSRTPASATNQKTWTWSAWVKRSKLSTIQYLFSAGEANPWAVVGFNADDTLQFTLNAGTSNTGITTTAVYRDSSAWYHIIAVLDTTQATDTNRIKLYVNGTQITAGTFNYPAQDSTWKVNSVILHSIGARQNGLQTFDGYMTEVNFIDGQALTPSSFGYTNPATGVWSPLAFVGTYGTNGFELNFSDNSNTTAATLGKDYSGNGNNWTPNNFSVTAGTGNDSLVDSPTSYGTDTGVGGEVRGNYATLNPLPNTSGNAVLTNGNLDYSGSQSATYGLAGSTISMSSGKWYWETTIGSTLGPNLGIGVFRVDIFPNYATYTSNANGSSSGGAIAFFHGIANTIYYDNVNTVSYTLAACTTGDVVSIALDMDNGKIYFAKNGSWGASGNPATQTNPALTGLSGSYVAGISVGASGTSTATLNFGQRPFAYTAPSGYKALCTQNLPTPTIGATTATQAGKYFNPVLYTGNGGTQSVTGVGFQPDWVWIKERNGTGFNVEYDAVRGVEKYLFTNSTGSEGGAGSGTGVTAFGSDGFTAVQGGSVEVNRNANTYVAWNWKANGSGSTNTAGSITSTVSANTTSGFSVVTYTGNGTQPSTIGHGLSVAPSFIIVKTRNSASYDWNCYHISLGNTKYIALNTTAAASSAVSLWNNTTPTSTVFTVNHEAVNTSSNTYVAYCFAAIAGYSAFGSYTGNGSADGPFVYCGFRPAYFLAKNITDGGNWNLYDATRGPYNLDTPMIIPNSSAAEYSGGIDLVSNGIKIRTDDSPAGSNVNQSGKTYIFAAFAQNPFKYSLAR